MVAGIGFQYVPDSFFNMGRIKVFMILKQGITGGHGIHQSVVFAPVFIDRKTAPGFACVGAYVTGSPLEQRKLSRREGGWAMNLIVL